VEDSEANLAKYQEAEWDQLQAEAASAIDLAAGDLKLAKHKLNSKQKINTDPELNQPYSQSEIEAERLTVARLQRSLKRAQTDRDILHKYTHPRRLRDLQTGVDDAQRELIAAGAERDKQLSLAKTQKETKALSLRNARDKLTELIDDRDNCLHIKAEQTGLVVYETRRRHWHRPITVAVDEEISPRQQLMVIPDSSTLVVKTQVYEAVREKVSVGLPARIRLDARAGKTLRGTVSKVNFLPDSQNPWLSPGVKVYPTTITFNDDVTGLDLKPGMTCDVIITLAELPEVLSVPIAGVFSDQDTTFCYRVGANGAPCRTEVQLGLTSETRAEIKSGLSANDVVLLVPPRGERIHRKAPAKEAPTSMPARMGPPRRGGPGREGRGMRPATTRPAGAGRPGTPTTRRARRDGNRPRRGRRGGRSGGGMRADR
jgi:HlyD family secretion protein